MSTCPAFFHAGFILCKIYFMSFIIIFFKSSFLPVFVRSYMYQVFLQTSIWPRNKSRTGAATPVRVDIEVMAMKGYSTLLIFPELEPHHVMYFSILPWVPFFLWGLIPLQKIPDILIPTDRDSIYLSIYLSILYYYFYLLANFSHYF